MPALASAIVLGLIGLLGMVAGMPWLFPSLGPTIAIQTTTPNAPGGRPWNVMLGHMIGMTAAFIAVHITGAIHSPSIISAHALSLSRVSASVLAVCISMLLQRVCKAEHPPAEATTLLIALGALEATPRNALVIFLGVVLVIAFGQTAKRFT